MHLYIIGFVVQKQKMWTMAIIFPPHSTEVNWATKTEKNMQGTCELKWKKNGETKKNRQSCIRMTFYILVGKHQRTRDKSVSGKRQHNNVTILSISGNWKPYLGDTVLCNAMRLLHYMGKFLNILLIRKLLKTESFVVGSSRVQLNVCF